MKAYIEIFKLDVKDVITTSAGCSNPNAVTGVDETLGGECACITD